MLVTGVLKNSMGVVPACHRSVKKKKKKVWELFLLVTGV